jgi:putative heme-binding domain-containing protein
MLSDDKGQTALEALWALNGVGAFDEQVALVGLSHANPAVRRWAVRLLGDAKSKPVSSILFDKLCDLASRETDSQVRSQLASTAKRLAGEQAIPLVVRMLDREQDAADVHVPLLLWWAIEDKAVSHRDQVVAAFSSEQVWQEKLAREVVLPRLARRYASQPTNENQKSLAALLNATPDDSARKVLLAGIREGFVGLSLRNLIASLSSALARSGDPELALRLGDEAARQRAIKLASDETAPAGRRVRTIQLLGAIAEPATAPILLNISRTSKASEVRAAAISALARFNDQGIGRSLVAEYPRLSAGAARSAALTVLLGRPNWTIELLRAIDAGSISRNELGLARIEQIRQSEDSIVQDLADKLFGKQTSPSSEQQAREVARVMQIASAGTGSVATGKVLFTQRCAVCHTLYGQGAKVGPDLTGYERRNLDFLAVSIVDPSAYVREEYTAFRIRTSDGQVRVGLIVDRGPNQITLEDAAQQKTVIPKSDIIEERAMNTSLMPEGLLESLGDQEIRDLFAYLSS